MNGINPANLKRISSINELRSPNKIWHYLPSRQHLSTEDNIPPPISIEIQPTSTCNLRCKWCSYWERNEFDSKTSNHLNYQLIENIAEFAKASNVKSIYLAGGGEPCAYHAIRDTVEKFKDLEISIGLITNGTLFSKKLLDIANHFSYLQISVISSELANYKESTSSSKGFGLMEELPNKIKSLYGEDSPIIGGMYVLTRWNYMQAFDVINFCLDNGFDYCSFRIAIDYEKRGVELPQEILNELKENFKKLPTVPQDYTNLQSILENGHITDYTSSKCTNIEYGLYTIVDPKGKVFLCVPDVGKEELCIGNLHENSFFDIWNSKRHKEIVGQLNKRYCKGLCHIACRSHRYNEVAQNIKPDYLPSEHREFV